MMVIILTCGCVLGPSLIVHSGSDAQGGSYVPRHHDALFTDSIDVCAVVIMGDALYRDIRLSGNRVRAPWASRPYRWARDEGARQGLAARERDAARR